MHQTEQQLLNFHNSPHEPSEAVNSHSQIHSPKLVIHTNFLCSSESFPPQNSKVSNYNPPLH